MIFMRRSWILAVYDLRLSGSVSGACKFSLLDVPVQEAYLRLPCCLRFLI